MKAFNEIMTTDQVLAPVQGGLDFLMITPSLVLYPDPGNGRFRSPPLAVGYILANVRQQGFSVKYIDMDACLITVDRLLSFIERNRPRLIGITAVTTVVNTAAAVARIIKDKWADIPVCLGGVHATMIPRQTVDEFQVFDFIVRGEGEETIPDVLRRLNEGRSDLKEISGVITRDNKDETSRLVQDIEHLPMPAWELFDLFRYPGVDLHRTRRELPIITARGCPFDCCF
jgi:anaerobic magnesium-protoporphyrin IX monomethyl ester cyclase